MALVLSFIHVVIVHINFHQPSHSGRYRAYHHRRPGLCHSPIPQSCLHAWPMASLSVFFCLPLDKAVALALDTHSGAQQLQAVCRRFKSLRVLLKENQNGLLVNAQTQDACTGAGESMSLLLTSDLAQLLQAEACLPRFEKKKKKANHSGETVGWPPSPARIKPASPTKIQKAQAILLLHRG